MVPRYDPRIDLRIVDGRGDISAQPTIQITGTVVLSGLSGRKQSADWVAGKRSGKEEPVDSAIQCKFGGRTGKDQEQRISIAPDGAHDRVGGNNGWRTFDRQLCFHLYERIVLFRMPNFLFGFSQVRQAQIAR
jgi:hypothetical protein